MKTGSMVDSTAHPSVAYIRAPANALERMRGLLFRPPLGDDEGMLIAPCRAIHTIGMSYAIDALFLDRDGVIMRIVEWLEPFRMACHWRAHSVLELRGGRSESLGVAPGQCLTFVRAAS